jgi:hypothetical protein
MMCKANPTSDPPQDCDWPGCGCDSAANKVLEHFAECGLELIRSDELFKLRARLRELIALMEGDGAFGHITIGETRRRILNEARELVPDMPASQTPAELPEAPETAMAGRA